MLASLAFDLWQPHLYFFSLGKVHLFHNRLLIKEIIGHGLCFDTLRHLTNRGFILHKGALFLLCQDLVLIIVVVYLSEQVLYTFNLCEVPEEINKHLDLLQVQNHMDPWELTLLLKLF